MLLHVETDVRKIVKMAIDMIPADSEYYTPLRSPPSSLRPIRSS